MSEVSELPAEGLVERVRALLPQIAAAAPAAEQARKVDDTVMKGLEGTGVFRSYVPRRFGGYEIDIDTFIDVGIDVGSACTSTGWITTFYAEHNWLLGHFAPEAQAEIFGAQPYVLAPGAISLNGRATPVEGGHALSGRWPWGTGIMHADWVMVSGFAEIPDRMPQARLFVAPREKFGIVDTWYASGLCATGSNDIVAEKIFVPAHMSQELAPIGSGASPGAARPRSSRRGSASGGCSAPRRASARSRLRRSGSRTCSRALARSRISCAALARRSCAGPRRAIPAPPSSARACGSRLRTWSPRRATSSAMRRRRAAPPPISPTTRCSASCATYTPERHTRSSTWTARRSSTGDCAWGWTRAG